MQSDRFEQQAAYWEDKLPNLANALRNKNLQAAIADIEQFDGWIRCTTDTPKDNLDVLVTDGNIVWVGYYKSKGIYAGGWTVASQYGSAPMLPGEVIAWMYRPGVPSELMESIKKDKD